MPFKEKDNSSPDFNFPQDVLKQAEQQMDSAAKANNPVDQKYLNGLLKGLRAFMEIEPENVEGQIDYIEKHTASVNLSQPGQALVLALKAKIINNYSDRHSWEIRRREVPGNSIPLWSPQQFNDTIADLYKRAGDIAANADVAQYIPKVLSDGNTLIFNNFASLFARWSGDAPEFYKQCEVGSPAFFYWLSHDLGMNYFDPNRCINLYKEYASFPWVNLLLFSLIDNTTSGINYPNTPDNEDNIHRDSVVNLIEEAVKAHPKFPYNDYLQASVKRITAPEVNIVIPPFVPVGSNFKIEVKGYNIRNLNLDLCKVSSRTVSYTRLAEIKEVKTINFKTDSVYTNTTLELVLNEPGTYALRTRLKGDNDFRVTFFDATPFVPALLSLNNEGVAITADFVTGAPVAGVNVIGEANVDKVLARTDADGIARFAKWNNKNSWRHVVKFKYQGQTFEFDNDLSLNFYNKVAPQTQFNLNILTDRAIYHPGETINWAVVAAVKDVQGKKSLCKGETVEVSLLDANRQTVVKTKVKTDDMGRADGSFDIPADGLTGTFTIKAENNGRFSFNQVMVSDFKAPVFEVKVDSLDLSPARVIIKGVASTFSGMPVTDAEVKLTVKDAYSWDKELFCEKESRTDTDGRFQFEVPADSARKDSWSFSANINVTNSVGQTASATRYFRFGKQYNLVVDAPSGNVSAAKPFSFKVEAKDVNGTATVMDYTWQLRRGQTVVQEGTAKTDTNVTINVDDLPAGTYNISVKPVDETIAEPNEFNDFTLYNIETNLVPEGSILFVPESTLKVASDLRKTSVTIGTPDQTTYIYVAVASENGIHTVRSYQLAQGFTEVEIPLSSDKDEKVKIIAMKNGKTEAQNVTINRVEPKRIKIEVQSFRDRLIPGATETWRMRISGEDAAAAAAVATMYNQALEKFTRYNSKLNFDFRTPVWSIASCTLPTYPLRLNALVQVPYVSVPSFYAPQFEYVGQRTRRIRVRGYSSVYSKSSSLAVTDDMDVVEGEEEVMYEAPVVYAAYGEQKVANAAVTTENEPTGGLFQEDDDEQAPLPDVEYRDAEVLQAFWMPRLLADDEGVVAIEFTVPNANTTWAFHMFGWTSDVLAANFNATALASKPVMVQSAVPRFLRQGDSATLRATVFNNTDSATTATTEFQIFNPADGAIINTVRNTVQLAPKGSAIIEAPVTAAPEMASVGYRIKAASDTYTDGEQDIIPILASSQILVESKEFYLDANGEPVTLKVPAAKDAKTTLQYCQNPVWTIVKAMRGVQWNDFSMTGAITTQLGSALMAQHIVGSNPRIASVLAQWKANPDQQALTSMLEKNEDLKTLLLNQTPWVQAAESNTDRMGALSQALDSARCEYVIVQSLKALQELQNSDGGFRWAKWSDEQSSVWVTVSALQDLGIVNSFGKLPAELSPVVNRAFRFVEKKALDDKKATWLHEQYALIATQFPDIAPSEAGEHLINKTCVSLKGQWRKMNLSDKAYTALILNAHGFADEARLIVSSIEQYGKYAAGRGLEFPSVKDMRSYGNIIQAVAMVTPGNPVLNQLRQWVILQAQATDDLGACNPDYIISSVLLTGTVWSDMTSVQPITIDGTPAMFAQAELGTGYFAEKVAPGSVIQIAPNGVTPSYGSIVSVFSALMKNVPAFKSDDLEITKRLMVQRNGQWVESDTFESGEEVRVQLLITAKRQLEYVAITDQRPAGLEPRDQLPGWVWSNGICFYRENRDASTRLFISYLPKGSYSLTYAMTAATPGTFASGVATLQSQYDPALTAHSAGAIIQIK